MRTSEVAGKAGVNTETLRYYERRGLLDAPPRTPGGYPEYSTPAPKRRGGSHTVAWCTASSAGSDGVVRARQLAKAAADEVIFTALEPPPAEDVTAAFWCACHGGQQQTEQCLLDRAAELNWIGYDKLTPSDAARRRGADRLVTWLRLAVPARPPNSAHHDH